MPHSDLLLRNLIFETLTMFDENIIPTLGLVFNSTRLENWPIVFLSTVMQKLNKEEFNVTRIFVVWRKSGSSQLGGPQEVWRPAGLPEGKVEMNHSSFIVVIHCLLDSLFFIIYRAIKSYVDDELYVWQLGGIFVRFFCEYLSPSPGPFRGT